MSFLEKNIASKPTSFASLAHDVETPKESIYHAIFGVSPKESFKNLCPTIKLSSKSS
jgi:hypothetical protein